METSVFSKTLTPLLQSAYRIKREQACVISKARTANITGESCVGIRTDCDSNDNFFFKGQACLGLIRITACRQHRHADTTAASLNINHDTVVLVGTCDGSLIVFAS